jgi:hypothetical protein
MDSYRGELAGILGGLTLIEAVATLHDIKTGKVRFGLDGSDAMKNCQRAHLTANMPSYDLLHTIQLKRKLLRSRFGILIHFFWVEGHQMERHGHETYEGVVNRLVDDLANEFLDTRAHLPPATTQRFTEEGWSISLNNVKQSSTDTDYLYSYTYGGSTSTDYWRRRHFMTESDHAHIDWPALDQGMTSWKWGQRKWLTKHLAGFSATGRVMKRRKQWINDHCPWCDEPGEDAAHLFLCPSPLAQTARNTALTQYWKDHEDMGTSPHILTALRTIFQYWPSQPPSIYCAACPEVEEAIAAQHDIGWLPFLWGRISQKWRLAQDRWLQRIATRWKKSVRIWASKFVRANVSIGWHLWELRNSYLHSDDHPRQLGPRTDRITLIQQRFQAYRPEHLQPSDQHWFLHYTVETLKTSPSYLQIHWLESVEWAYLRQSQF